MMRLARIAMSGLFSLAVAPIFILATAPLTGVALTFGDSGWTMLIGVGIMLLGTGAVLWMHLARSKREFRYAEPEAPSEKISNHLVALSSAAILAVYSAGYFHTRPAANRFIEEAVEERAVAAATNSPATSGEAAGAATAAELYGLGSPASPNELSPAPPPDTPSETNGSGSTRSSSSSPTAGTQSDAGSADAGNNAAPNPDSPTPATAESQSESSQANDEADAAGRAGDAAAGRPAKGAPAAKVQYKDGTYQGWGTCRHGDIQATVVIDGGKIASADISKCYTRYPCDIIQQLPGQVVTRQSIAVDYVSGATQSVYAFQQAVAAALAMAKKK